MSDIDDYESEEELIMEIEEEDEKVTTPITGTITSTRNPQKTSTEFSFPIGGNSAMIRIMRDMRSVADPEITQQSGFSAMCRDENVFVWDVKFFGFDKGTPLERDLEKLSERTCDQQNYIRLEMTFPDDYPFSPPFVRIVSPRFQSRTGHITTGGSICMEVLTSSGWSAVLTIETLLLMIRSTIIEGDARIILPSSSHFNEVYSMDEAQESFRRVARDHGWV